MKRVMYIYLILIFSFISYPLMGFNINPLFKKGYYGNLSLSGGATLDRVFHCSLLTSHGCSFGKGFYCGCGSGIIYNADKHVMLPMFMDLRFSLLNRTVSPFVAIRAGGIRAFKEKIQYAYLAPYVGIDVGKFSFSLSWECMTGKVAKSYPSYIIASENVVSVFSGGIFFSF